MLIKRMTSLFFVFVFIFMLGCSALAAEPEPYYVGDGTVNGAVEQETYYVSAYASAGVRSISVSGTLYESGWFGYSRIDSCSNTSSGVNCSASGSFSRKSGKTYRLDYTATFYYTDGTSETLTGSTTG